MYTPKLIQNNPWIPEINRLFYLLLFCLTFFFFFCSLFLFIKRLCFRQTILPPNPCMHYDLAALICNKIKKK